MPVEKTRGTLIVVITLLGIDSTMILIGIIYKFINSLETMTDKLYVASVDYNIMLNFVSFVNLNLLHISYRSFSEPFFALTNENNEVIFEL